MIFFNSVRHLVLSFILVSLLIAVLFWIYLNIQASVQVSATNAKIQLAESLPTKIHVGNHLETHAIGSLNTVIPLDRTLNVPLKGKYLADLAFQVKTPIDIHIDYETVVEINTVMPLEATTDLIYQKKYLPKFPIKVEIPIKLSVPFKLNRDYQLPIFIDFNGPIYFDFNDRLDLPIKINLNQVLKIDDPITMTKVSPFRATMYNSSRESIANMKMNMNLPLKYIGPKFE